MKGSIKTIVLTLLLFSLLSSAFAKEITLSQAVMLARNFYMERFQPENTFKTELSSQSSIIINSEKYFIFNFKNSKGFILVSGNDRLPPVAAYSFQGNIDIYNRNDAFDFWLSAFGNQKVNEKTKKKWDKYLSDTFTPTKSVNGVGPLLSIAWGQSCYYNDMCPIDSAGNCYHARTGCGATAMAMILKYWDYPVHGYGENSYENPPYGTIYADLENTFYEWDNMPPTLNSQSDSVERHAIAELMYQCGVAVNMVYGTNASSSDEWNIRNAFTQNFDYSSNSEYVDRADFPDSVWTYLMQNEIDNGRPVFYGISSGSGGHFVVMDGYQDDDYFHFNWGYGNLNGYYKTFDELPVIQQAIINIKPNNDTAAGTFEFISYNGIFNDGSNHSQYLNEKSYEWLINPPEANKVFIMFTKFSTEYKTDFVNIYDGETSSAPLLGSYSGHNLPPLIESTSGKALVQFITNNSTVDKGWELRYTTQRNLPSCSGVNIFTDSTSTFDDGSGSSNYIDNADCFWLIKPDSACSVTLHFNNFYTETDWDFLYVYDGENLSPDNLLATLTGHYAPADIKSTQGAMLLHFHSDWNTNRPGWEVSYTAGFEKITLDMKVFLESDFNGTTMNAGLNGLLPTKQPFDTEAAAYCYYEGTDSVKSIPNQDIVDWVLVELRDAPVASMATSSTVIGQKAAFLHTDGSITSLDGSSFLSFNRSFNDSLYAVILHRNHIAVMSAVPLTNQAGIFHYDFTTDTSQAYLNNLKMVNGKAVMYGGDLNGDGIIDDNDLLFWKIKAGNEGYLFQDATFYGQVDNKDKNDKWLINYGVSTKIPEID